MLYLPLYEKFLKMFQRTIKCFRVTTKGLSTCIPFMRKKTRECDKNKRKMERRLMSEAAGRPTVDIVDYHGTVVGKSLTVLCLQGVILKGAEIKPAGIEGVRPETKASYLEIPTC